MKLDPGDHRSLSMDSMIVHGIWQAGDGLPPGTDFDYKWS